MSISNYRFFLVALFFTMGFTLSFCSNKPAVKKTTKSSNTQDKVAHSLGIKLKGFKYSDYPNLEQILSYLIKQKKYALDTCQYNIAKKPLGYFLQINSSVVIDSTFEEILIWSSKTKTYQKIESNLFKVFDKTDGASNREILNYQYLVSRSDWNYNAYPFYGYSGYESDNITLLENKPNLSLKEMEILARSYDHIACNYINPGQFGNSPPFAKKIKRNIYSKLEKYRVEGFLKNHKKSKSYYEKIIKQNPNYNTLLIGNVQKKFANDEMNAWLLMKSVLENERSNQILNEFEYPEIFVQMAKNYLDACALNAVLFTHGDSDTYPLWYVQQKLGYRTDVVVINTSLFQVYWYKKMIQETSGLNFSLDFEKLHNQKKYYCFFDGQQNNGLPIKEALNYFSSSSKNKLESIPLSSNKINYLYQGKKTSIPLKKTFLLTKDMAFLDIIENNPERKIFTSNTVGFFNDFNFYNQFSDVYNRGLDRGKVFELTFDYCSNLTDSLSFNIAKKRVINLSKQYTTDLFRREFQVDLSHLSRALINLKNSSETSDASDYLRILDQKTPNKLFYKVSSDNMNCLMSKFSIKYYLGTLDSCKNDFNPYAISYLNKINISPSKMKKQYACLESMYSLYVSLVQMDKDNAAYKNMINKISSLIGASLKSEIWDEYYWTKSKYIAFKEKIDNFLESKFE
ncbi:MAG: hypothetical protein P8I93_03430 [Crocinitomicaceae bacterium]|nr:hypothetical protein [Crocinitomicaceae bacterium]